jgi:hypothetical protein
MKWQLTDFLANPKVVVDYYYCRYKYTLLCTRSYTGQKSLKNTKKN